MLEEVVAVLVVVDVHAERVAVDPPPPERVAVRRHTVFPLDRATFLGDVAINFGIFKRGYVNVCHTSILTCSWTSNQEDCNLLQSDESVTGVGCRERYRQLVGRVVGHVTWQDRLDPTTGVDEEGVVDDERRARTQVVVDRPDSGR